MGRKSNRPQKKEVTSKKTLSTQKEKELNRLVDDLLSCTSSVKANQTISSQWEAHKTVHNLLCRIRTIQSGLNIPMPERNEKSIKEFEEWAIKRGVIAKKVKIAEFCGYDYGIQAAEEIDKREMVISVPRNAMITIEYIRDSPLAELYDSDAILQQMPNVALAMLILVERFRKDNESFWKPYLDTLPTDYTVPLYYNLEDFDEIKGSPVFEISLKLCKSIARQYAYFKKVIMKRKDKACEILKDVFTYDQYRWAVATVMTRQNHVPSKESRGKIVNALIPFWDICNHRQPQDKPSEPTTVYDLESDSSTFETFESYRPGDQVFIHYGKRSNCDFVVHNGFCYMENKDDELSLKFGISHEDPCYGARVNLLSRFRLQPSGQFSVKCTPEQPFDCSLLTFLRIFKLNSGYLEKFLECENLPTLLSGPVFAEHEEELSIDVKEYLMNLDTEVLKYLNIRMQILLKSYSTTMDEDVQLLQNGTLSAVRKVIVSLRLTEKRILQNASRYCLNVLNVNAKQLPQ